MSTPQKNLNIGVFFGSRSPEHDISIITGHLIISGLRGLNYPVIPVYLGKRGDWLIGEEFGRLNLFTDPGKHIDPEHFPKYRLDLEKSKGKLVFRKKFGFQEVTVDIAFPAVHGSHGEDGTLQGLFEMFDVPYVGCDVTSSAIAMDKVLTKQLYVAKGIPTTKFLYFTREDWDKDKSGILRKIKDELVWPVFVKPARLGSSIGVAKVKTQQDLEMAIEVALHYDSKFLAEESVEDLMDVTCSVLGNQSPVTSLLQESVFEGSDFFSYEEKYLKDGGAQLGKAQRSIVIPARLDEETAKKIRETAAQIYKLLGCSGIARVDFLYDKTKSNFYANEVNTLPGTLYHHQWKASGVGLPELLEKLIKFGLERRDLKQKIAYTFESDLLRKTNSIKLGLDS